MCVCVYLYVYVRMYVFHGTEELGVCFGEVVERVKSCYDTQVDRIERETDCR